jgi:glycine C-acetyltransferase
MRADLTAALEEIRAAGLYKAERVIASPQGALLRVGDGQQLINLCSNNYLGLADHPAIVAAAREGLERWGFGMASVRFICGTQEIHRELEQALTRFLGTEDTILYSSCFDANGGLFETLLDDRDAVISDALNHASIIDGIRLCKAKRYRYANRDMADLEQQLQAASAARYRLIATDGVFSMDGYVAPLRETLGKALGGASGGYTSGRREIVELLRQRSRPYLFSNSIAPPIVAAALKALELVQTATDLRTRLRDNTQFFRARIGELGFTILPGEHPIVPVMIGDAAQATALADALLAKGVYVIGFSFPVVPRGAARIRAQISAVHTRDELERATAAFGEVRGDLSL